MHVLLRTRPLNTASETNLGRQRGVRPGSEGRTDEAARDGFEGARHFDALLILDRSGN